MIEIARKRFPLDENRCAITVSVLAIHIVAFRNAVFYENFSGQIKTKGHNTVYRGIIVVRIKMFVGEWTKQYIYSYFPKEEKINFL